MKIETQFYPGQTLWFMLDNKPTSAYVENVNVNIYQDTSGIAKSEFVVEIGYSFRVGAKHIRYNQDICFASKEELIASL